MEKLSNFISSSNEVYHICKSQGVLVEVSESWAAERMQRGVHGGDMNGSDSLIRVRETKGIMATPAWLLSIGM